MGSGGHWRTEKGGVGWICIRWIFHSQCIFRSGLHPDDGSWQLSWFLSTHRYECNNGSWIWEEKLWKPSDCRGKDFFGSTDQYTICKTKTKTKKNTTKILSFFSEVQQMWGEKTAECVAHCVNRMGLNKIRWHHHYQDRMICHCCWGSFHWMAVSSD